MPTLAQDKSNYQVELDHKTIKIKLIKNVGPEIFIAQINV